MNLMAKKGEGDASQLAHTRSGGSFVKGNRRSVRKQKEDEERAKLEEAEKLTRNSYLAGGAILRMVYMDVEDKFIEIISEAYECMRGGAEVRKRAKQAIIAIQRTWRKKMTRKAAREYRMQRLSQLYHVEQSTAVGDCAKIQAHIRGNLCRVRLLRGKDLVLHSDSLVGSKKMMPRGRQAIELYKECYNDFLNSLRDKDAMSRVGTELFVHELLAFRETWNHERAQKKASFFGTDADEDRRPLAPPMAHPEPILS